jgi:hypothetical protein
MSKRPRPRLVLAGDQMVAIVETFNEEGEKIVGELQDWIDSGWRCVSLVAADAGMLIALFEARSQGVGPPKKRAY